MHTHSSLSCLHIVRPLLLFSRRPAIWGNLAEWITSSNVLWAKLTKINHTRGSNLGLHISILKLYTCLLKMIVWGCVCFTRNSVRLAIRKIMYAPSKQGEQPSVEVSKEFIMSPNKLHLEASLDKELYYHGETIAVNVHIQNNSNKSVKKVKVSGEEKVSQCD